MPAPHSSGSSSRPSSGPRRPGDRPGPGGRPAGRGFRRGGPPRRKVCRFCADKTDIDYKNVSMLRNFITERGKILSGRITGTCARHQRHLTDAVKRARMLAFLPFAVV